ncbi:hypothetical protein HELRODRAFT_173040 [Helobdella robusta]|uniref:Uncharacterized protein n=1 Tax=Helobdella robusta TaxID=6412 RepID=T1F6A5_HELRO|nr:hypothetical protein HELRODRAFT_173040 [Helobdella robusta]ESO03993.1 hypothetical protein HELRODRAFT_173040 [Helobdella robusta]
MDIHEDSLYLLNKEKLPTIEEELSYKSLISRKEALQKIYSLLAGVKERVGPVDHCPTEFYNLHQAGSGLLLPSSPALFQQRFQSPMRSSHRRTLLLLSNCNPIRSSQPILKLYGSVIKYS